MKEIKIYLISKLKKFQVSPISAAYMFIIHLGFVSVVQCYK